MTFKPFWPPCLALALLLCACARPAVPPLETLAPKPRASGEVHVTAASGRKIGLEVQTAGARAVLAQIRLTGKLATIPEREVHITLPTSGRVRSVHKRLGDHVRRGELLAVLDSSELGQAQSDFLLADAQARLKAGASQREQALFERQYAAKKELLAAQSELAAAGIELERTRNRLLLLGSTPAQIARLARGRALENRLEIHAPAGGIVTSKSLTTGELSAAGSSIFTLVDASKLWLLADIHETDLACVRPGAHAVLYALAYPNLPLAGTVESISESLSTDTHTAQARILLANPHGLLKPFMYATAQVASNRTQKLPSVPAGAVILAGKQRVVYVATGPESYRRRPIEVGAEAAGWIAVTKGVVVGEQVVAKGALLVDAAGRE